MKRETIQLRGRTSKAATRNEFFREVARGGGRTGDGLVRRYSKLCNAIATAQSDINFNGPERRHLWKWVSLISHESKIMLSLPRNLSFSSLLLLPPSRFFPFSFLSVFVLSHRHHRATSVVVAFKAQLCGIRFPQERRTLIWGNRCTQYACIMHSQHM